MKERRERARRLEFFFGAYIAAETMVLEVGPGDGWLGEYLIGAGFRSYRRLHSAAPADLVGELENWRELGIEPASIDLLIAFDCRLAEPELVCFRALVKAGGLLFVVRRAERRPIARRLAGWLTAGRRRSRREATEGATAIAGFRTLAERRLRSGELWLRLQRLAEGSS